MYNEKYTYLPIAFAPSKVQMGLAGREKMQKEFDRGIVVRAYLDAL